MTDLQPIFPPTRAKLIFNPISGIPANSPAQLLNIITEMQALNFIPEVHLVEPGTDLTLMVEEALHRGIRLFVVSGGDGTVDTVGGALVGTRATLGIIPTGTQNNVALSLGIPGDIPDAVALLRHGRRIKVDVGIAALEETRRTFLEACSVGLLSALFSAADDIQHGNLARIGDFLATLVTFPPAELHLELDMRGRISTQGHVVLIGNMPYIGPHYQIAPEEAYDDGLLDVLVFANLTKLDLIGNAVQLAGSVLDDPRIQHYQVRSVKIDTNPSMPVLVDGFSIGEGPLTISVRRQSLAVIAGEPLPAIPSESLPAPM